MSNREDLFEALNREMEAIGIKNHNTKGGSIMAERPPLSSRERMEIELEDELSFYKSMDQSNKTIWDAIKQNKLKIMAEITKLRRDLQKALEERDSAVEELAKALRIIERVRDNVGVKR